MLQMDLNISSKRENIEKDASSVEVNSTTELKHSYKWTAETVYVDIVWYFDWESIPDQSRHTL